MAHTIDLNHDQWETKTRIIRNEFGPFLDRIAKQDSCVYVMCYVVAMDYPTSGDPISGGGAALIDTDSDLAAAALGSESGAVMGSLYWRQRRAGPI